MDNNTSDVTRKNIAWTQAIIFTLLLSHLAWQPYAHANATTEGAVITDGNGTITESGNTVTIQQNTDFMAIEWPGYNVAADERVHYIQPGSSAISFNRILGNSASQIHGRIDANGQIILINPNGVFFSPTSVINVGSLVASGLDMSTKDFMNGNYVFREVLGTKGQVINKGLINASTGGSVTLLGKQVHNDGLIMAKLGSVNLAAGTEAVLTFDKAGLIGIGVTKEVLQENIGVDPAVLNSGEIQAEGGQVLLTASVSKDIFSKIINTDGIEATSVIIHEDGSFSFGDGADVENSGSIDVSTSSALPNDPNPARIVLLGENVTNSGSLKADNKNGNAGEIEIHAKDTTLLTGNSVTSARSEANGKGGLIKVLGDKVGLFDQATVDVSGAKGGGQALIGGDYQGKNTSIRNASKTYVSKDSVIKADALESGDGGRVIVWADEITRFYGHLYARGGSVGGDGGFAEVSGKEFLDFRGAADLTALMGDYGTILFDPLDIVIRDAQQGDPTYVVSENDAFSENPDADVFFTPDQIQTLLGSTDVELQANRNITVQDAISMGAGNTRDLTLKANDTITIDSAGSIDLGSGDIFLIAGSNGCGAFCAGAGERNIIVNSTLDTAGTITLTAADDIEINEAIGSSWPATGITLQAGDDITLNASLTTNNTSGTNGDISLTAGFSDPDDIVVDPNDTSTRNIVVDQLINSGGGDISLSATDAIDINNAINTAGSATLAGNFTASSATFDNDHNNGQIKTTINSASDVAAGDVTITTSGDMNLGAIVTTNEWSGGVSSGGGLSLTSTGGAINQSSNPNRRLNISGLTTLAASGNITLDNANNDFNNVNITTANNVSLRDGTGFIGLQGSVDGNLSVRADGTSGTNVVRNPGALTVGGNTSIRVSNGESVYLGNNGNDFTGTVTFIGNLNNLNLYDNSQFTLNAMSVSGDLTLFANGLSFGLGTTSVGGDLIANGGSGSLTQSGILNVTGTSRLEAGSGGITLLQNNNFDDAVSLYTTGSNASIRNIDAITLGASDVDGDLSVEALAGDIGQVGGPGNGVSVSGTTNLTLANGQSILLDNDDNNLNIVNASAIGAGRLANVTISNGTALDMQGIDISGDLTLTTIDGNITDSGNMIVDGVTSLSSGTGTITLDEGGNNFAGLTVNASGDAFISDINDIQLVGDSGVNNLHLVAANDITDASGSSLTSTGTTHLEAGRDVLLELGSHDLNVLRLTTANDATVHTASTVDLGTSTVNGNLTINSTGSINNTAGALTVSGTSEFVAGNGQSIELTHASNSFTGGLTFNSSGTLDHITLNNTLDTVLAAVSNTNDLTVTSGGDISGGPLNVAGTTTLSAVGHDITLTDPTNDFNVLNVNGANSVEIADANDLGMGHITATTTTLTALAGQITDENGSAMNITGDTATLIAIDGVGAGDALETQLANLTVDNQSGGIGINNTGNITVKMTTSGNIDFYNNGDVTLDLIDGIANDDTHSTVTMTVENGSVFGNNPQTVPDIRGHNVSITVNDGLGDFGQLNRPIYLDVHGVFTLFANFAFYDFSGDEPHTIVDNSSVRLTVSSLLDLLSNQKLIELESLSDLDPHIFTAVRNYYHEDLAIMMPEDQLYSEEEIEKQRTTLDR